MSKKNSYKAFVRRYLAQGTVAVSVGLATVASVSPAAQASISSEQTIARSFTEKLSIVRSAVSECVQEQDSRLAQILPKPPPRPFRNFDNAPPFDNFANVPFSNFGKAPLDPNK